MKGEYRVFFMPYQSCPVRRLPRTPYYIILLTFNSNLTDAAIQCCCVITAQADKRLFRAASKNRRKNYNHLHLFLLHFKYPALFCKKIINQTAVVMFRTVSGRFTCRKRATFDAKVTAFLCKNHRVLSSEIKSSHYCMQEQA